LKGTERESIVPQAIPPGLTRDHVLRAIAELDAGGKHPFGPSTGYQLVHHGKSYPPKAVIGLACRHSIGRVLKPEEFSGGEAAGQANFVRRRLGFTVTRKEVDPEEPQTGRD
jgi:5-methylcytosine-specific restriction protein B